MTAIDESGLSPLLSGALHLRAHEKVLGCWRLALDSHTLGERQQVAVWGGRSLPPIVFGAVVVTNQRLVCFDEAGVFSKTYSLRDSIELDTIRGTSLAWHRVCLTIEMNGMLRQLSFIDSYKCDPYTLDKRRKIDPVDAKTCIDELVAARIREIGASSMRRSAQIPEVDVPATESVGSSSAGSKFCRHCGTRIPSDSAFCEACGKKI